MPVKNLEAAVRQAPGIAIIDLEGEIDALGEETLNDAYARAAGATPQAIVLNLSQVDYINSTGIALIVGLLARSRKAGQRLLAYGVSDHYVEIFKITRLSDFLTLCADEPSALKEVEGARN